MISGVASIEKAYSIGLKDEVYKKAVSDLEATIANSNLKDRDKANAQFYDSKGKIIPQYSKGRYVDHIAE